MIYFDNSATTMVDNDVLETYNKVCKNYPGNANSLHKLGIKSRELEDYATEMPVELIKYALEKAVLVNKKNIQYIKGILNSWQRKGIKNLAEAKKESEEFEASKNNKQSENSKKTYNNYEQRNYKDIDINNLYAN